MARRQFADSLMDDLIAALEGKKKNVIGLNSECK